MYLEHDEAEACVVVHLVNEDLLLEVILFILIFFLLPFLHRFPLHLHRPAEVFQRLFIFTKVKTANPRKNAKVYWLEDLAPLRWGLVLLKLAWRGFFYVINLLEFC